MTARSWQRSLWLLLIACLLGGAGARGQDDEQPATKKPAAKKTAKKKKSNADLPPIKLPDDPNQTILSYDPGLGAGQPERKGAAPMLKIKRDGEVIVTNPVDGTEKTGKLKEKELNDLLSFIVHDQEFLTLTAAMIDEDLNALARSSGGFTDVRGIGTSVISVQLADKQNQVNYRAAMIYHSKHPKSEQIARFALTEKKLQDIAVKHGKLKRPQ